jgi:hypothetical protein
MRRSTASSPLSDPKIDPRRSQQRPGWPKGPVVGSIYSLLCLDAAQYCWSISDGDEFLYFIRTDLVATADSPVKPRRILTFCLALRYRWPNLGP